MQGLSFSSLKRHPSLIPLYIFTAIGAFGALGYTIRLALFNPDVTWNKRTNPEPNNAYKNKQYKFYNPSGIDYKTYDTGAPKFDKEKEKD